jgi:hypothetical protein
MKGSSRGWLCAWMLEYCPPVNPVMGMLCLNSSRNEESPENIGGGPKLSSRGPL